MAAPSSSVPPDEKFGDIFGWLAGIVTGCIPVSSYATGCSFRLDGMVDNFVYDVLVCVILILTRAVSVDSAFLTNVFVD